MSGKARVIRRKGIVCGIVPLKLIGTIAARIMGGNLRMSQRDEMVLMRITKDTIPLNLRDVIAMGIMEE